MGWLLVVVYVAFLAAVFCVGRISGRTAELRRQNERRRALQERAAAEAEVVREKLIEYFSGPMVGDIRYDSRGWVYLYWQDDWQQLMIREKDGVERWLHKDACVLEFIEPFTEEEEETLPHKRAIRHAHEMLAEQ